MYGSYSPQSTLHDHVYIVHGSASTSSLFFCHRDASRRRDGAAATQVVDTTTRTDEEYDNDEGPGGEELTVTETKLLYTSKPCLRAVKTKCVREGGGGAMSVWRLMSSGVLRTNTSSSSRIASSSLSSTAGPARVSSKHAHAGAGFSKRVGHMSAEEAAATVAEAEPTPGGVAMALGAMGAGAVGAVGLSILGVAGALYGASFAAATLGACVRACVHACVRASPTTTRAD